MSGVIIGLGGQWRVGLTKDVTHLFALSSDSERYDTALHYQDVTRIVVVVPHWFDDCATLARRLDTKPYEWPSPALFNPNPNHDAGNGNGNVDAEAIKAKVASTRLPEEKRALFRGAALEGKMHDKTNTELPPAYPEVNVWQGRKILLSTSLALTAGRRQAVEAGIWRAGGEVIPYSEKKGDGTEKEEIMLVEQADVFVTRYRHGWAYIKVRISFLILIVTIPMQRSYAGSTARQVRRNFILGVSCRVYGGAVSSD
jgi:hypothetical protein